MKKVSQPGCVDSRSKLQRQKSWVQGWGGGLWSIQERKAKTTHLGEGERERGEHVPETEYLVKEWVGKAQVCSGERMSQRLIF